MFADGAFKVMVHSLFVLSFCSFLCTYVNINLDLQGYICLKYVVPFAYYYHISMFNILVFVIISPFYNIPPYSYLFLNLLSLSIWTIIFSLFFSYHLYIPLNVLHHIMLSLLKCWQKADCPAYISWKLLHISFALRQAKYRQCKMKISVKKRRHEKSRHSFKF